MIGPNTPRTVLDRATRRPLTLLDCGLGGHTGHFTVTRIDVDGRRLWACDPCIAGLPGITQPPAKGAC